jgi:[acyl-carrier-protein] S-malonyltransferase
MNLSESAFVFPGQGSQSPGMLTDYFDSNSNFSSTFDEAREILGIDFKNLIQNGSSKGLAKTQITQPLMLTANIAVWKAVNIKSSSVGVFTGHSLGEFAALVAAEVLSFEDALNLVSTRASLMQQAVPEGKGGIAAIIGLSIEEVTAICLEIVENEGQIVSPANINSPLQTVISGTAKAVELAMRACKKAGAKRALPLAMSVPSHCELMEPAAKKFTTELDSICFNDPKTKVFQNYSANYSRDPEEIKSNLVKQICNPVRWVETIKNIRSNSIHNFVECGPGKILSGLVKRIVDDSKIISLDSHQTFKEIFIKL